MATKREPKDLSRKQLVGLVEGLRELMYGDTEVWNPDMEVSGSDVVEWVHLEMVALGLVPDSGPRAKQES